MVLKCNQCIPDFHSFVCAPIGVYVGSEDEIQMKPALFVMSCGRQSDGNTAGKEGQ